MVRCFALVICLAAASASAQVQLADRPQLNLTPTTRPAPPATKPSPEALHRQAYEFLRVEKFDKATPLLNRAYLQTPVPQRTRALVLNRALLDLVQKANVMRGVKDVYEYLARNSNPDEQASNLLGSLLELVALNPRWRDGPVYADAFREFARREAVLERHRPGFRRWGARWLPEEEFQEIKQKDRELEQQIAEQEQIVVRRTDELNGLSRQYNTAAVEATAFSRHVHIRKHDDRIFRECTRCTAMYQAQQSMNDTYAEMQTVSARLQREKREIENLKRKLTRPQWPKRYDPIDPDAPPPPPPAQQQNNVLAPRAQPATVPTLVPTPAPGAKTAQPTNPIR